MEATINRKQTSFRLSTDLISRLRQAAMKQNRSLNNFVESVLMDVVYNEPNEETKAAIEEAKAGKSAGTIDMTNFDTFMKSINDIE
ncbi:MAG: toxin-antitoxin system protein [Tannerellaceae bacterium]|jgi:predicted transcriptional regulator|nr:toxin-antitoxin system protein [Tannerellaceae bacterium]